MATNSQNVLAGLGGLGNAFEIAWFADTVPSAPVLPVDPWTAPAAAFKSIGFVEEKGLEVKTQMQTVDIEAYGEAAPVRTLITRETRDFHIGGIETNPVTLAIKSRNTLASITPLGSGMITIKEGPIRDVNYAAIFHGTDGVNIYRRVLPNVRLISEDNEMLSKAQNIAWGFDFRALPDANGIAVYTYIALQAFGAS